MIVVSWTAGKGPLVEFRPGVFAREGERMVVKPSERSQPVVWEFRLASPGVLPGWVSVDGPLGHHKRPAPAELLSMPVNERPARRRRAQLPTFEAGPD